MRSPKKSVGFRYSLHLAGFAGDYCWLQNFHTFKLAVSLGGVESLVEHPASMTHGPFCMSDEDRKQTHVDPGLIRLRYIVYCPVAQPGFSFGGAQPDFPLLSSFPPPSFSSLPSSLLPFMYPLALPLPCRFPLSSLPSPINSAMESGAAL